MKVVFVDLKEGQLVEKFVECIKELEGHFALVAGHTTVDASSLMGIYGLDLSKPVLLQINSDSENAMESLKPFVAI